MSMDTLYFDNFVCEIVKSGGLTCDTHTALTSDGFSLSLFRVRDPNIYKESAPAVLLQHGLFSDSKMWVTHRDESLSFQLAKNGYDVWLGNNRGSIFSRKNTHLDPIKDTKAYFDYSFYEHGKYDLPALMEYIIEETG